MKMRRAHLFAVPLLFALLAGVLVMLFAILRPGGGQRSDAHTLPFQLEDVIAARITPKLPFFVVEVDNDGNDDLLINEPTGLLWYRLKGKEMSLAGRAAYEHPGSTRMVTDANGDGRPEFFVLIYMPKGVMLSCHDWFSPKGPSVPLYTIGPLLPSVEFQRRSSTRINPLGRSPAGNGIHPKIFIGVNTLKADNAPRYLLSFDGVTGKEQWRYCFGPKSLDLVCDSFGGSVPRVVFTTIAVLNGISCNGIADSTSYVFCLDERDGSLLWSEEIGAAAARSRIALADVNGDGRKEILLARHLDRDDPRFRSETAPWTVAILNGDGVFLSSVSLPDGASSIHAMDLDDDPVPGILVEQDDGNFVILDHKLRIRRILRPIGSASPATEVLGVWDLDGCREPEIVCRMDSVFMVRDQKGNVLAERKFVPSADMQIARYDGKIRIVAASSDSIYIMTLEHTPLMTRLRAYSWRSMIAPLAAAVFLACAVGIAVRRRLIRRGTDHLVVDGARNDLLTAMSAFGHGGSSLKIIDRIRLHLKNWDRVQSDAAAREDLFTRLHATFMETVVPELKHIVMLAHRARVPEEIWGAIVARAGLADQAMEGILAAGSGKAVGDREGHIARALEALGDVDESIAGIRAYLRSVFRTPVAEALERSAARCRYEHGDKIITLALPSGAPVTGGVFISSIAFDKVFEALLANSARATEGRTGAAIAIEVQWEGDYCKIDVRDNGCGIPREHWERAFDRSYTTKEEGGFGLYYARGELARFGGKIFILDSVAGSATTVRVVLRKS
jgi:hypothetical protein